MTLSHMSPYMSESSRGTVTPAIIQICVFIGLSIVMFVWTERTLTYSDNETKFIPKRHA